MHSPDLSFGELMHSGLRARCYSQWTPAYDWTLVSSQQAHSTACAPHTACAVQV